MNENIPLSTIVLWRVIILKSKTLLFPSIQTEGESFLHGVVKNESEMWLVVDQETTYQLDWWKLLGYWLVIRPTRRSYLNWRRSTVYVESRTDWGGDRHLIETFLTTSLFLFCRQARKSNTVTGRIVKRLAGSAIQRQHFPDKHWSLNLN